MSWHTWMRGLPRAAVMLPMVVPMRAPAGLPPCQGDPGPNTVQVPRGVIPVYVTSCWDGSSFSEIICGICLSTRCDIAEMLVSSASTLQ